MNIFITGGTGFIGSALCAALVDDQHQLTVLTRDPAAARKSLGPDIGIVTSAGALQQEAYDAVINLAGLPIAGRRWSARRQAALRSSRIALTQTLVEALGRAPQRPRVLISASAVGYYGDQGNRLVDESTEPHDEFSHQLCRDWEQAAQGAEALGVRVCRLRLGLVVGPGGGFLQRMLPPFRLGLGGRLGSGQQWMSWVHLQDVIGAIRYTLLHDTLQGAFNTVAPQPVQNEEFTRLLARALDRRPRLPVPAAALKLALGELSQLLLTGQRVVPSRLLKAGFDFHYPTLDSALNDVLR